MRVEPTEPESAIEPRSSGWSINRFLPWWCGSGSVEISAVENRVSLLLFLRTSKPGGNSHGIQSCRGPSSSRSCHSGDCRLSEPGLSRFSVLEVSQGAIRLRSLHSLMTSTIGKQWAPTGPWKTQQ